MKEKKKVLENLLLDIDILNGLDKWTNNINFFEISGMRNNEIKHSQVLSWFLDPNESHFLGDQVVRRFLQKVITNNVDVSKNLDIFDISLIDYSTFSVKREWRNIDILIQSDQLKIVFAIENKIYAPEGKTQLSDYYNTIKKEFPEYKKVFIYLTREGESPSDVVNWCIADYRMLIESLEESKNSNENISDKTKMIINDYISMIRRNFGMDNELKRTVQKIYFKHKKAFDLIFEVTSNITTQYSEYLKDWINKNKLEHNINFDPAFSTNSIIRFTTPYIDELFPFDEEKEDGWKSGHSFFYEMKVSKQEIVVMGMLSNFKRPNSKYFMTYNESVRSTKWREIMLSKIILNNQEISEGLTEDIIAKLDKNLHESINKHIFEFEDKMRNHIKKHQ